MFTYILDKEMTREVDKEKVAMANEVLELAGMKEAPPVHLQPRSSYSSITGEII